MAINKKAVIHRTFNSILLMALATGLYIGSGKLNKYLEEADDKEEIQKIMVAESLRTCVYKDSLGKATIGFGHLVRSNESFTCITTHEAMDLLKEDYMYAKRSVQVRYPWAKGEVQRVLINLSFQLGENRLAGFKKTLAYMEQGQYFKAAGELLDSEAFRQTPNRLVRHAARLAAIADEYEE